MRPIPLDQNLPYISEDVFRAHNLNALSKSFGIPPSNGAR